MNESSIKTFRVRHKITKPWCNKLFIRLGQE